MKLHASLISKSMLTAAILLTGGALVVPLTASAQSAGTQQTQSVVTGTITDVDGEPIIGASVLVKGQAIGVSSDIDGRFTIKAKVGDELNITSVGYLPKTVKVTSKHIDVVLEEHSQVMDEVVVIGYGTQRKGDVTSAVASVKAEDFNIGKIGDAAELVKGKIAGLSITNSSGNPTAGSSIRLRGTTTLTGSVSPLILVDGIEGGLNTVAPENIESIDVLKDASAAAIYGTRGANGVILITTKSGKRGSKASASYANYFSFSKWSKTAEFMDVNDVIFGRTNQSYAGYETDWMKAITRKAGFKHNHDFQVSGGTDNATYSGNFSYQKEEGIMRGSDNERMRFHVDYTQFLWDDILKVNFNALVTRQKYSLNSSDYAYRQAVIRNPSEPVYNDDGSYYENFEKLQYYNPVGIQNEYFGNVRNRMSQITGNITLEPIRGWQTNVMLSWNESTSTAESFTTPEHYSLVTQNDYNGYASKSEGTSISKTIEATSRYNHTWNGVHRFDALVGYSYLYNEYDGFNAGNGNFSTTAFLWNNLNNGSLLTEEERHASVGSYKNDNTLIGFFGRISYGYDNRYNLMVSLRHEGSSKFGANHKWGNFPSASAGWNIMNESFWKESSISHIMNEFKFRVGYGVTGVIPGDSYMSLNLYKYADAGDILSLDGEWMKSLEVKQNYNPDLKWETTRELNFGIDYGFFNDRLHGTIDYYIKTTKDLLYDYAVPMPPNLYGYTLANVGEMRNTGIEVLITGIPVHTRDFSWESSLTLSHNKNKLVSLSNDLYETDNFQELWGGISDPVSVPTHCMEVGYGLGDFWGLKFAGYDVDGFALVETPDGLQQFTTELNTQENRQRLGNGMPKLIMGWGNTFRYKNFDLSLQFTGQFGYKILNVQRVFYENNSINYNTLKSAGDLHPAINYDGTPAYDENGNRIMVTQNSSQQQGFWSDHLENGDFLKLTNATLGYTFPIKGAAAKYISNLRVYANATNLFTITKYKGIDPEVDNNFLTPGVDNRDKYPTTRSYTVGMSVTF